MTDADLVLGYLNPDKFLGGRVRLDRERAARAIEERIGAPLGLDLAGAAAGSNAIVDARMRDTIVGLVAARVFAGRGAALGAVAFFLAGGGAHGLGRRRSRLGAAIAVPNRRRVLWYPT